MAPRQRRTFLLIGDPEDACSRRVQQVLRTRGHDVVRTSSPLAAPFALCWQLCTEGTDRMVWVNAHGVPRNIAGVLLRPSARWLDPEGWNAKDLAYMQSETQAALIAWLWTLPCPVINRPIANLWFRPYRSYPEWHRLFAECGLPVAPICVTNEVDAARAFGQRWAGRATYVPLTSTTRYPLEEARHWDEIAKLLAHVPVCLTAPTCGPSAYATVVGDCVVWNEGVTFDPEPLNPGLVRLARRLRLDCVQIEI